MVEQLPAIEQKVSFLTGHGPEQATFTGALLWSVLEHSEMLGGDRRTRLRRNIVVTGAIPLLVFRSARLGAGSALSDYVGRRAWRVM